MYADIYYCNQTRESVTLKMLCYCMSYSNVLVTMNMYTYVDFDDVEEKRRGMEACRKAQAEIDN